MNNGSPSRLFIIPHSSLIIGGWLMAYEEMKHAVWQANMQLIEAGLVVLTFGNASAVDRQAGVMAIKPSGVDYKTLKPQNIVVLSVETGTIVDGDLRPSSDAPTHLVLYRAFQSIGGVAHTHSTYAAAWAQACREIPCLGTTHADYFHGPVPLTRHLSAEEIREDYEISTGKVIVERFREAGLSPDRFPGVLVANHGPFTWASSPLEAVENSIALEEIARTALLTLAVNPGGGTISQELLDKHFLRKHGPGAYYGQP